MSDRRSARASGAPLPRPTSTPSPSSPAITSGSTSTSSGPRTESPFGTTIAHGNLTLSLVDGFRGELISSSGFALGVNYGWNKIRFPAPVPVDSRVRAKAEVVSVEEIGGGWWQVVTRFTLEVDGNEKPCFVGDSVTRVMAPTD